MSWCERCCEEWQKNKDDSEHWSVEFYFSEIWGNKLGNKLQPIKTRQVSGLQLIIYLDRPHRQKIKHRANTAASVDWAQVQPIIKQHRCKRWVQLGGGCSDGKSQPEENRDRTKSCRDTNNPLPPVVIIKPQAAGAGVHSTVGSPDISHEDREKRLKDIHRKKSEVFFCCFFSFDMPSVLHL